MIDWDAYRAAYPRMTYPEVVAFHERVWADYPDQEYCSRDLLVRFFLGVPEGSGVVELGGWRGEMASMILAMRPDLWDWCNLEICADAVVRPVTDDPRYRPVHPRRWPWELPPERHEVAVLAHVIEHISELQFRQLVPWLVASEVRHVYVEAPLHDARRSWRHSTSAHVLELGWNVILPFFAEYGFHVRERHDYRSDFVVVMLDSMG